MTEIKKIEISELLIYISTQIPKVTLNNDTHSVSILAYTDSIDPDSDAYAIYDNGNIIGFSISHPIEKNRLCRLYIEPEYRRKGYGSKILDHLNYDMLGCISDNKNALAFYKKNNFSITFNGSMCHILERNK